MSEPQFRIDPLTGGCAAITPWRQDRPNLPADSCPFCPGGLEAPDHYDVRCITNRWPALPAGRHEVVLHSPHHNASFPALGSVGTARVIELWSERTAGPPDPRLQRRSPRPAGRARARRLRAVRHARCRADGHRVRGLARPRALGAVMAV